MSSARKPAAKTGPAEAGLRKRRSGSSGSRMEDVAALAGVSMITVSRVLNTPGKVAESTRQAVEAAIRKTGYVPNLTAGSLASNKSRIVGAIVPTIDNSIFADTVRGLSEVLATGGYQLLLGQSGYDTDREESLVATFLGRRVDGLVLTGSLHSKATLRRLRQSGVPVVETWDLPARPIDMVAGFSNLKAGKAVAQALIAQGHRRLCFAGGPDDRSAARLRGVQAAMQGVRGATLRIEPLAAGVAFEGGRSVIANVAGRADMPQAIFFGNDALAAGALVECQRRGIAVPRDLAIVGFADLAVAAAMEPAITTVRVPTARMGEVAGQMLLARFSGAAPGEPIRDLGFELIRRGSA